MFAYLFRQAGTDKLALTIDLTGRTLDAEKRRA